MKNLRGVLGGLLIVVIFQFTLVSCVDNSEIIKNDNATTKIDKEEVESPDDRG
jgi:hypothetical protein